MLGFYAERLPSVEINNTFYRMPKAERSRPGPSKCRNVSVRDQGAAAHHHIRRLTDCEPEAAPSFEALDVLGRRLGAVLVQLPPHARVDVAGSSSFLGACPPEAPLAFEFRHASWQDERVLGRARAHTGPPGSPADVDGGAPAGLPATASWTYLRLRARPIRAALDAWKRRATFRAGFRLFQARGEAAGPVFAERMLAL